MLRQIFDGIDNAHNGEVERIKVPSDRGISSLENEIEKKKPDLMIALGRKGYQLARRLSRKYAIVSGMMPISPGKVSGISLLPSPDVLFNFLNQVAPRVKRVYVLHNPNTTWLIRIAAEVTKAAGIELMPVKVESTKEAVNVYQDLFKKIQPQTDAIWLSADPVTSHDKLILPMILKEAWQKKFVVFSSKPGHARRGVLFSVLPNNKMLGKLLVDKAVETSDDMGNPTVDPNSALMLAVNVRTAGHLGISYTNKQKESFDLIFPSK